MSAKRKIEIFSAGCPECKKAIRLVRSIACPFCEIEVLDMHDSDVARKAVSYGVLRLPAIAVDGKIADCCAARGVDAAALKSVGIGVPIP